jgi:hypothetical protein
MLLPVRDTDRLYRETHRISCSVRSVLQPTRASRIAPQNRSPVLLLQDGGQWLACSSSDHISIRIDVLFDAVIGCASHDLHYAGHGVAKGLTECACGSVLLARPEQAVARPKSNQDSRETEEDADAMFFHIRISRYRSLTGRGQFLFAPREASSAHAG